MTAAVRPPDTKVLTVLLDAIAAAARHRRDEATLDAQALEAALRDVPGPRLPCSAELFVAPVPRRPRKPPGTGWLLGLHAPAGRVAGPLRPRAGCRRARRDRRAGGGRTAGAAARGLGRRRLRAHAGADRSRGAPEDVAPDARALALERRRP